MKTMGTKILDDPADFAGYAFISFKTESEKQLVLDITVLFIL